GRVEAAEFGYRFERVRWQCPLSRTPRQGWRCEGALRGATGAAMRLALDVSAATTDAALSRGDARIALQRSAAVPDATRIDLARVPLAWAQALLAQVWADGRLNAGVVDGTAMIESPAGRPMRIDARLALSQVALESQDGSVAVADLGARVHLDYRQPANAGALLAVDATLQGGELLYGNTYVALADAAVQVRADAVRLADGAWDVSHLSWRDGNVLAIEGAATLSADGAPRHLDLAARSGALDALPARYLSGWLGLAGLSELALSGEFDARLRVEEGTLAMVDAGFRDGSLLDPRQRFRIEGLDGSLRHAANGGVDSELRWRQGRLYDLAFGAIRLPLRSDGGTLRLRESANLSMLGGEVRLEGFTLRPPGADGGLRVGFGLALDGLELGQLSRALGWPEFGGTLSGRIPSARYADERLEFDGGLSVQAFDGRIDVGALAMERPFGVAPTLSADLALHGLDLLAITEVFDFGSITGRLHGRIGGLRLIDWSATAFDAELHTEPRRGVRQRISQRAVQDISSVGDASFVTTLQGRLIGLFDDFGYRRIGIACRLENEICRMSGLHSAGEGFTIVEGAGVPKLQVVGFNREVDWPTLLERLAAVAVGDVAPVVQ
ncbi:MAG: hypothetical protein KIS72_02890, partial [Luteimonas sp.]|nr:hypothetical protein [Luteimonas sp.]